MAISRRRLQMTQISGIKQIGIEWCTQQSKELVAAGMPVLHYYSMGKAENIKAIAKNIF